MGCNFIPSTAVNQLEMWQADTFDVHTIDRELGWAADIEFNSVRVFLHDLVWQAEPETFKQRIDTFLGTASRHNIRTVLVIFDDCWNDEPKLGRQPAPLPGVHNSGWMQSPGSQGVLGRNWARLERYVSDIVGAFGRDPRVLFWDLYNELGNNGHGVNSLPLLQAAFGWARAMDPIQPLTAGIWFDQLELNEFQTSASDIITFHHYHHVTSLQEWITRLRAANRPLV